MTKEEKQQLAEEIIGEISDIINTTADPDDYKVGQILKVLEHHELISFVEE